MDSVVLVLAAVLMAVGIPMALVPMVPVLSYMFVIALVFGFYDGFVALSAGNVLALAGFVLASIVVDNLAGVLGAKYGGAHTKSLFWGIGGAILGTFMFPLFGSLVGLFLGVLAAELYYMKTNAQALRSASGALIGAAVGVAFNLCLGIAFLATFLVFALS